MVALLVAMSIMAILMTAALPAWHTMAQREKEAELVFRGEQIARANRLYQRRFANAPAPFG
jgi:type II secretory pathway pseudopilin PulG